jgi:hypothetical protein
MVEHNGIGMLDDDGASGEVVAGLDTLHILARSGVDLNGALVVASLSSAAEVGHEY